jgi:hypothetical protein
VIPRCSSKVTKLRTGARIRWSGSAAFGGVRGATDLSCGGRPSAVRTPLATRLSSSVSLRGRGG